MNIKPDIFLKSLPVIFILFFAFFLACKDKSTSSDPPAENNNTGFIGEYRGVYIITDFNPGGISDSQHIEWTFSDRQFWCEAIDTIAVPPFVCDFNGFYELSTQIRFYNVYIPPGCNDEDMVNGDFDLQRVSNPGGADSVIIQQFNTSTSIRKSIRLEKKP